MSRRRPTILIAAGEPSGDLHGGAIATALRRRYPDATLFGIGGSAMAAAGVELSAGLDRLSVMGFAEVVRHLPYFTGLLRRLSADMKRRATDLVIPIDYPGFNLRLARRARNAGIPVLYYIAPQVWAWHRKRAQQLAELADWLVVAFPFEEAVFRNVGARVSYFGHPLMDVVVEPEAVSSLARELGVQDGERVLALFPGSRAQELAQHLTLFAAAADRVAARHPEVRPVIAAAAGLPEAAYHGVRYPRTSDGRALLRLARAALVKSGTSTVEAALADTPMVVAYRTHPLTYWLARRLVQVEHIGMVNLVAGQRLVPELVQQAATTASLAAAIEPLLEDGAERTRVLEGLARVRRALGGAGDRAVADQVAAAAAELID
ncbi:MAG: lipid-A-disaccharide synthase [Longimicrobiales bacterium]